ncbi:type II toxin-antitoxin system PrlF family antitoxin [Candidatus Woesearchaeota archaeon]|nr:type II toxin-antitoxin system PrlF family antitoxin [Candidatus Woesearchaeota archaeon]
MKETKITTKGQTTIPNEVRTILGIKPGDNVAWNTLRGMVIVDVKKKIKDPVKFLTSQIKIDLDAVKLVKESREDFR